MTFNLSISVSANQYYARQFIYFRSRDFEIISHTNYEGWNCFAVGAITLRTCFTRMRVMRQVQVDSHVVLDDHPPLGYESAAAVIAPRQITKTDQET